MQNYYSNPYINYYGNYADNRFIYTNRQNTYTLDRQIGDVNGDGVPDIVYLVGDKNQNSFYENIRIMVQDGSTLHWYVIPLYPNYSTAFDPWLFLGSFTGFSSKEIMVSLPVGGSGALTYYYVISFYNNKAEYMLGPEQFTNLTQTLKVEVKYMDNYRVLVESNKLNQSYIVDVSDRKEFYEGTVYNKEGKLIKPLEGFVIYQPHLYPIKMDGIAPYKLLAQNDIAGTSHADGLGYTVTYWKYDRQSKSWILDPEYFWVMLG
ncbi:hypothetical protein [Acetivibrio straminisolvens]|jgi:hypothetical protein|uniref:VCBS repeat-containing protein n=1 Tax=Acetivibrio straminisolvens JCM 21531 TaxID=1294263 RepID=W4VBP5_9FIRM|nr:hypothetical protein [Acetivibrio straminisolvens]GAE90174.1 hypothetical protein JCM21531_3764 [Acetivibrio straminisolvens JCM 21531]